MSGIAVQANGSWDGYFASLASDLGARLVSVRPQVRNSGGRRTFFVDLEIDGRIENLYIRGGRDQMPPPFAYRQLEMERNVMDWCASHGVPVAAPVHLSKEPAALAMKAVPGEDDFLKVNQKKEGAAILSHYIEILADMHSHDVAALAATGMHRPAGGSETALYHLEQWIFSSYERSGTPRNPLCTWVRKWMIRNAPGEARRTSLVQGDTGPGNFVFGGNRVKALVDWELAHLGDPMEDLGAMRLRDVWTPFPGGVRRYLDEYAARSGHELELEAIRWYSIKLCLAHPFVLASPVHDPASTTTPAEWLAEYHSLARLGLDEIGVHEGIPLKAGELPAPRMSFQSHYHDSLASALRNEIIANIQDPFQKYRAEQAWRTAQYLRGAERYLECIETIEIEEIGELTGKPARNHEEALQILDRFIESANADADAELLEFFYRQQSRMEALMPGAIGRSEGRTFTPIE